MVELFTTLKIFFPCLILQNKFIKPKNIPTNKMINKRNKLSFSEIDSIIVNLYKSKLVAIIINGDVNNNNFLLLDFADKFKARPETKIETKKKEMEIIKSLD